MLYKLIYLFHADFSWLNVFRYITFRTILSTLTALIICFIFGGWVAQINSLQEIIWTLDFSAKGGLQRFHDSRR